MIIQTYFANRFKRLKQDIALNRSLIICSAALVSLVFQNHQALAQIATVEVESGVTLDKDGNTVYLGDPDYLFITPDGKILFHGRVQQSGDNNLIFTSPSDAAPTILVSAGLSGGSTYDIENIAFNGKQSVAYLDPNEDVFVVNVDTGMEVQQGSFAWDLLDVTDDGRALYFNRPEDNIDRIMLGEELIYLEVDQINGFDVNNFGINNIRLGTSLSISEFSARNPDQQTWRLEMTSY
jgi:hypothetical protein